MHCRHAEKSPNEARALRESAQLSYGGATLPHIAHHSWPSTRHQSLTSDDVTGRRGSSPPRRANDYESICECCSAGGTIGRPARHLANGAANGGGSARHLANGAANGGGSARHLANGAANGGGSARHLANGAANGSGSARHLANGAANGCGSARHLANGEANGGGCARHLANGGGSARHLANGAAKGGGSARHLANVAAYGDSAYWAECGYRPAGQMQRGVTTPTPRVALMTQITPD